MRIAVLGSTKGSDLQAVIDARLPGVDIKFVLSNKQDAYILERARLAGLQAIFLDPTGLSRVEYDWKINQLLEDHGVDLVLLIGYMKLLSSEFVARWRNRVINVHPSILPAFAAGMDKDVHAQVLRRGCKITGATLIFIDEGADTGPIIMQKAVPVLVDDTVDTLKARVQAAEQEMLLETLELYRDGRIKVEGSTVLVA